MRRLALVLLGVACAGCAAQHPVLYPGAAFTRVAPEQRARDVDECTQRADAYVSGHHVDAARVGTHAAAGAVIGGAAGAAGGAVLGSPARHAAAGAAGGGAGGLVHGHFRSMFGANKPDRAHRRFVERCLRERGYDTIGWE